VVSVAPLAVDVKGARMLLAEKMVSFNQDQLVGYQFNQLEMSSAFRLFPLEW